MNVDSLPLALPRRTLRLYARYWLPLTVWYLVGRGLHDLLLELASHVNTHVGVLGYSILAGAILCTLAAFVLMFLTVQEGLPTVWALHRQGGFEAVMRQPGDAGALQGPGVVSAAARGVREVAGSVGLALLPFLIFYSAWNLFLDDIRSLSYRTWQLDPLGETTPQLQDFTYWFAGAAVVAFALRALFERITRRTGNPVTSVASAVFEANWMFFAAYGITQLVGKGQTWFAGTVAADRLESAVRTLTGLVPALPVHPEAALTALSGPSLDGSGGSWLSIFLLPIKNGIILPIMWLAITGVAYGREMEDVSSLLQGERARRLTARTQALAPTLTKRYAKAFPPPSVRERYVPMLHAARLMVASGVPAVLLFCVFYSLLGLVAHALTQAVTTVIGPQAVGTFWVPVQDVLSVGVDALTEPLRICLLAVTFDWALSRFTYRSEGTSGSRGSSTASAAVPVPGP